MRQQGVEESAYAYRASARNRVSNHVGSHWKRYGPDHTWSRLIRPSGSDSASCPSEEEIRLGQGPARPELSRIYPALVLLPES
jgi:hypothetical protein